MKYALIITGMLLGGLFINEKMDTVKHDESKTEIVYGHRIGQSGQVMLVTK
jgi:hypothetical protein